MSKSVYTKGGRRPQRKNKKAVEPSSDDYVLSDDDMDDLPMPTGKVLLKGSDAVASFRMRKRTNRQFEVIETAIKARKKLRYNYCLCP